MKEVNCSKFKPNHYYILTHKEYAKIYPIKCIVKIIKYDTINRVHDLEIIKILESSYENGLTYKVGTVTSWYEEWCSNIKELKGNDAKLLAMIL